jgi:hypothetical protein
MVTALLEGQPESRSSRGACKAREQVVEQTVIADALRLRRRMLVKLAEAPAAVTCRRLWYSVRISRRKSRLDVRGGRARGDDVVFFSGSDNDNAAGVKRKLCSTQLASAEDILLNQRRAGGSKIRGQVWDSRWE